MIVFQVRFGYGWDRPDMAGRIYLLREKAEAECERIKEHVDHPRVVEIEIIE